MKYAKLVLLCVITLSLVGCWDKGGGEKVGSIIKLNRQGFFCKTWEAEIIRGGLNTGSGVVGTAFHFTIEDDSLAKQVEQAMNSQQEVRITYRFEAVTWCRSDSPDDAFLVKIEPLGTVSIPPVQSKNIPMVGTTAQDQEMVQALRKQQEMLETQQKQLQQLLDKKK